MKEILLSATLLLAPIRVKSASLAAEAKIIKKEEAACLRAGRELGLPEGGPYYAKYLSLREHRMHRVRFEARHAHLAYCALRGTPYERVEATAHTPPDLGKVRKMALKHRVAGTPPEQIDEWIASARRHLSRVRA